LNSSSERRVLDRENPDSNQSARDRQPIQIRPEDNSLEAQTSSQQMVSLLNLPDIPPETTTNPIYSAMLQRLAIRRLTRLALRLEARLRQFTTFSSVSRHTEPLTNQSACLMARRIANTGCGFSLLWQTFQETSSTQWQKN
jgi:hypothetical protein